MAVDIGPQSLKDIYDALPTMPQVYEDYITKRKKLARVIHDIQDLMDKGEWKWFRTWEKWDPVAWPVYCFTCHYPVRVHPVCSISGKLKTIECDICSLVHYDSKFD